MKLDFGTVEHGLSAIPAGTAMDNPLRIAREKAEARERATRPCIRLRSTKGGLCDGNL